jgi:5-methylcytosine-specific restriction endonuclease McrA
MTKQQEDFLELSILEQMKYADISKKMNVDQKTLSIWWDELKTEREKLSTYRQIWKSKCKTASFWDFKIWHESAERKCYYCKINEDEIDELIRKDLITTKRLITRGRKLEIERISSNEPYDNLNNLVFCCYWCNNAKTDEFSSEEFKHIGQLISNIWNNRLRKARE